MRIPDLLTWIGGVAEPSAVTLDSAEAIVNPNTGEVLTTARASSPAQVERAIAAATEAHAEGRWSALACDERAAVLERFAQALDARADEIAWLDAINAGVPISVTTLFASSAGDTVRGAVTHALALGDEHALEAGDRDVRVRRVPWGPAALITPWNAPSAMATKKLAYALAAGATVILKPSPASPFSAQLILEAAAEAEFPAGVVSMVLGGSNVGAALTGDARIAAISMTGSTPAGRAIAASAAPRFARLQLELGSNNPALVLSDADITYSARELAAGAMKLSGQWCEAPRHVFVMRDQHDALVEALRHELATLVIGDSTDAATTLGPVAFAARKAELEAQRDALVAAGARALTVGSVPAAGSFVAPTLILGERLVPESEIFGPLLLIEPVDSPSDAIARANSGHVGLAGYVFTQDLKLGRQLGQRLVAGEVKLNGTSVLDMAPGSEQSFFGTSGIGGHGDAALLQFFTGVQVIGSDIPGLPL